LFLYAACFSYAYVTLDAGVGALIVFASVQITMITYALSKGRKLNRREWIGVLLAFGGFVYLLSPGISAPPIEGLILMTLSGFGWGMYSVRGKSSENPLEDTSFNFLRSLPFLAILIVIGADHFEFSERGVLLAVISGAVTSGIGYTIWYMALTGLNNVQASVVQLSVPALATAGGVLLLSENLSLRFLLSSVIILGGIFLVVTGKRKLNPMR
jgi:drug/metabolite transporter (DMT)-like permease